MGLPLAVTSRWSLQRRRGGLRRPRRLRLSLIAMPGPTFPDDVRTVLAGLGDRPLRSPTDPVPACTALPLPKTLNARLTVADGVGMSPAATKCCCSPAKSSGGIDYAYLPTTWFPLPNSLVVRFRNESVNDAWASRTAVAEEADRPAANASPTATLVAARCVTAGADIDPEVAVDQRTRCPDVSGAVLA